LTIDAISGAADLRALLADWFMLGMTLRGYPIALIVCLGVWAAMGFGRSAFFFSFSWWFALQWAAGLAFLVPQLRLDVFVAALLSLFFLTFALFAACAIVSLYLYVTRRPIEERMLIRLELMLGPAHVLQGLFLLLGEGLAIPGH